ncbi:MAG: lipopolysaccharide biosynthesis protein [Anaeromyxobacteraceae bacterium]
MDKSKTLLGRAGPLIAARLVSGLVTLSIPLVLARTMPIAEYGTYKQLFLLSFTASAILPFGVSQSLYFFVPRSTAPRAWFAQTLAFLAVAGAVGAGALWAAGPFLATALSNPGLRAHAGELALYTGLFVAAAPLEISMTSRGRTRLAAGTYLASDALRAAALALPAALGHGLHAMMAAMIAFAALRAVAAWTFMVVLERGPLWESAHLRRQLVYALPFGIAILFSIPQQFAHQFIVAHAVGPALFAIYAVGCFELPFVDLFYTPTGEVLMVQLGELERAGRVDEGAAAFRDAVERLAILLLPPIFFLWAVAPTFIVTAFGVRFADATPVFRVCLFAMPLGIWPLDATLRARGETRHILRSYVLKALVTIPLAWVGVQRFGLMGAAASYVVAEYFGRAFLAWRVPASLSTPARATRLLDLVPLATLVRTAAVAVVLAAGSAALLRVVSAAYVATGKTFLSRAVPLLVTGCAFGACYLGFIALSHLRVPGPIGAVLARRRAKRAVAA